MSLFQTHNASREGFEEETKEAVEEADTTEDEETVLPFDVGEHPEQGIDDDVNDDFDGGQG